MHNPVDGGGLGSGAQFLAPMVFDFLWEELRLGEQPYPLEVPSHGATMDERRMLRLRTFTELSGHGIMDAHGRLEPRIEGGLALLASGSLTVDAVQIPEFQAQPMTVLAATDGNQAVLAVQDGAGIWLRSIYPDAIASEVIGLLPPGQRGSERSITMSRDDALRTAPAKVSVPARGAAEEEPQTPVFGFRRPTRTRTRLSERTAGDPEQDYARLLGQPRLRGGQIAANSRDKVGMRRRSPVLAWFDTASGRYLSLSRIGPDGHEWVTISSTDTKTLRSRLAEMISDVR
ncbi:MAG: ESX secretion-associated protein EspG [Pseudonocardiaceae bacterium]